MIEDVTVNEQINNSMMEMSSYVLLQRAIPDFRDGMKPVNRRILISMNMNGTTNFIKSATVEGRIMQLHPHGGSYGSIVSLVQKDKQLLPMLIGKGSWGHYTSTDHTAAHARYTEVKLGRNAIETMKELKEKSVRYIPNYDGTIMVPEVLPVTYPTILSQYQEGMAIGFSSTILSYNPWELLNAIKEYYETGNISTIYPDFITGGTIFKNDEAAEEIMSTGKGSLRIRAKMEIDGRKIIVNQLPYGVKREKVISKIIELNKQKKLSEVVDVRDGTSFKGMKIVIKARRNTDMNQLIEKLYQLTTLETSISANMNVLLNGKLEVVGTRDLLKHWTNWREKIIKIGYENKLTKMKYDLHIVKALEIIQNDIDDVISIIRFSKDDEVLNKLMDKYGIDLEQAEYISKMTIRSLNVERLKKRIIEISEMEKAIKTMQNNIDDPKFLENQVISRMEETFKAVDAPERKTSIEEIDSTKIKIINKVNKELKKASDHEVLIQLTKNGYLLKSNENGKFVDEPVLGDEIIKEVNIKNDSQIGVILPNITIGKVIVDDIKGMVFLPGLFDTENIVDIVVEDKDVPHVLLGYEDGQLTRIPASSFITTRTITKNGYYDGAKLVFVQQIRENENENIIIKYGKKEKVINIEKCNLKNGRRARGQRFIPKTEEKVSFTF